MILLKSGGILPGFSWFLFNYWKVLHEIFNFFFRKIWGPKISSDKVALEPTLFWSRTHSPGVKRRFRHRHFTVSGRNDLLRKIWPVTAKNTTFAKVSLILIVTWYYSRPFWPGQFTGGPSTDVRSGGSDVGAGTTFWVRKSVTFDTFFDTKTLHFKPKSGHFPTPKSGHFPTPKWSFLTPRCRGSPPPHPSLAPLAGTPSTSVKQSKWSFWL